MQLGAQGLGGHVSRVAAMTEPCSDNAQCCVVSVQSSKLVAVFVDAAWHQSLHAEGHVHMRLEAAQVQEMGALITTTDTP